MTRRGERFYRLLIRLYPAEFRARYGRAMLDFHRDRLADARAAGESSWKLWTSTSIDVISSALVERARHFSSREETMTTLRQDVGYAIRGLIRRPGFTAVTVATIALGIGANAAIFSVVNGVLLRPMPFPHPEQVVSFGHTPPTWLTSEDNFIDYHRELKSFTGLAAFTKNEATIATADEPERVRMVRATDDFFSVLGVQPLLGRTFASDEFTPRQPRVLVISYGLWQRRFGGDRAIIGKTLRLGNVPRTIVGVMPPHFNYPEARTEVWLPFPRLNPDSLNGRGNNYLFMVGRLAPGATVRSAFSEADGLAKRFTREYPQIYNPRQPLTPSIERVDDQLVGSTRPYLLALLGAVGFVLLIACANVANLLLVRGEGRQKEMAVRAALGASRARLLTQLLTESSMLSLGAGAIGLFVAWAGVRSLVAVAPSSIPRLDDVGVDWRVVGFTALSAIITSLLIGVVPAWRAARSDPAGTLKEGGRLVSVAGSRRLRRALVAAEVMLAVVALSGAGMLLRSLWHLERDDLGFDPHGVLTASVSLAASDYTGPRTVAFFHDLVERVRRTPGVRAAGVAMWLPVVDAGGLWGYTPEGRSIPPGQGPAATPQEVTPGYFATVGLSIVAGREFTDDDRAGAPLVAMVSERFARAAWPTENPLGKRFKLGGPSPWMTVVGVVRDIRARGFGDTPEPTMYFPNAQSNDNGFYQPRSMVVLIRTDGDPTLAGPALRRIVREMDKMAPVSSVRTLEDVAAMSISNRRFNTGLLAGFAALALVLAGIGTYGVISYGVTQRAYEIGVRIALGADDGSVLSLVISEGAAMCAIGLVLGLGLSLVLERSIGSLLVELPAVDVVSLGATSALLAVVAIAACVLPARRALHVSPLDALRG